MDFTAPIEDIDSLENVFVSREYELNFLKKVVSDSKDVEPVLVLGLGGVGKTALLHLFTKKYRSHFPGGILRFSGHNEQKLLNFIDSVRQGDEHP
ncbi:MAG: hypothetical protein QG552_2614, partial [Thermodesulfobacteriota bacterium]|nr:hypothetical protein [Thermodesulfobacteriota bacterium]